MGIIINYEPTKQQIYSILDGYNDSSVNTTHGVICDYKY